MFQGCSHIYRICLRLVQDWLWHLCNVHQSWDCPPGSVLQAYLPWHGCCWEAKDFCSVSPRHCDDFLLLLAFSHFSMFFPQPVCCCVFGNDHSKARTPIVWTGKSGFSRSWFHIPSPQQAHIGLTYLHACSGPVPASSPHPLLPSAHSSNGHTTAIS